MKFKLVESTHAAERHKQWHGRDKGADGEAGAGRRCSVLMVLADGEPAGLPVTAIKDFSSCFLEISDLFLFPRHLSTFLDTTPE